MESYILSLNEIIISNIQKRNELIKILEATLKQEKEERLKQEKEAKQREEARQREEEKTKDYKDGCPVIDVDIEKLECGPKTKKKAQLKIHPDKNKNCPDLATVKTTAYKDEQCKDQIKIQLSIKTKINILEEELKYLEGLNLQHIELYKTKVQQLNDLKRPTVIHPQTTQTTHQDVMTKIEEIKTYLKNIPINNRYIIFSSYSYQFEINNLKNQELKTKINLLNLLNSIISRLNNYENNISNGYDNAIQIYNKILEDIKKIDKANEADIAIQNYYDILIRPHIDSGFLEPYQENNIYKVKIKDSIQRNYIFKYIMGGTILHKYNNHRISMNYDDLIKIFTIDQDNNDIKKSLELDSLHETFFTNIIQPYIQYIKIDIVYIVNEDIPYLLDDFKKLLNKYLSINHRIYHYYDNIDRGIETFKKHNSKITEYIEAIKPLLTIEKRLDPNSGRYFYANHVTRTTTWDEPQRPQPRLLI